MNKITLKTILDENKIRENVYSLNGGITHDTYCIEKQDQDWSVYYTERGKKINERFFKSESDACEYLLSLILNDPKTR